MRRMMILVMASVLLVLGAAPAAAQRSDVPAPLRLAERLAPGAVFYAGVRTDANALETLDGLLNAFSEQLGEPNMLQVTALLRDEGISAWLGGAAAVAMYDPNGRMSDEDALIVLVEVRDRQAAEAYLRAQNPTYEIATAPGAQQFFFGNVAALLTDDLLILAGEGAVKALRLPGAPGASLLDEPSFRDAVAALPVVDFAVSVIDLRAMLQLTVGTGGFGVPYSQVLLHDSVGTLSIGLSKSGPTAYLADVALIGGRRHPLEAFYLAAPVVSGVRALDERVLAAIPADVHIALASSGLHTRLSETARTLAVLIDGFRTELYFEGANRGMSMMQLATNPFLAISARRWVVLVDNMLRGGLNLSAEQLRAVTDGTTALAVQLVPGRRGMMFGLGVDAGVWMGAADDDSARALVAGVAGVLESYAVDFAYDADAARIDYGESYGMFALNGLVYAGADALELETKQTLVAVPRLTDALADAPVLEGATDLAWINVAALRPLLERGGALEPTDRSMTGGMAGDLARLVDGLLISARVSPQVTVVRFGLLLGR